MKAPILLAAALAAGCASLSPVATQQLDEARTAYRAAAADPHAQVYSPQELERARAALHDAERMAQEGAASELVEHNAYLAEQRARIALQNAQARRSEAGIAAAVEERRRQQVLLREREAQAAREQARIAEQEAAKQTTATAVLGAELKRLEDELADMRAQQTERGWVLTLRNELLFDAGGATLKPGAERSLDNLVEFLRKHPDREVAIEGFTDSMGPKDLNQRLSERRAQAVKEALVARGIEARRVDTRGYGASFPVASNATPVGRQLNRRVEIIIDPS